jgi:hypothetical protein
MTLVQWLVAFSGGCVLIVVLFAACLWTIAPSRRDALALLAEAVEGRMLLIWAAMWATCGVLSWLASGPI